MPQYVGKDGYKHHWEVLRGQTRPLQPNPWDEDERYFQIALILARYSEPIIEKTFHAHIMYKNNNYLTLAFASRKAFYNDDHGLKVMGEVIEDMNRRQKILDLQNRILESIKNE